MDCKWVKSSPSLNKGICIINNLDDTKIEQFLRRIVTKLQLQDTEIFTEDENQKLQKIFRIDENNLLLAIKTVLYLYKRLLKFIFMPNHILNDLKSLGFSDKKVGAIVKVWSQETTLVFSKASTEADMDIGLDISWKLNAELSSNCCKKTKTPKAYLNLSSGSSETELELTHYELYLMFLQLESIQTELDNLIE